MGYLLAISTTFTLAFVGVALLLGVTSHYLYGTIQDWVLFATVVVALILSWVVGDRYDTWRWPRARR